jgi:hypothetical protein
MQTRNHKTLHRKHQIDQHEPKYKQGTTKYYAENIRLSNTNPKFLGCSGVRVTQSYAFCLAFCDPLFVVGFVLLNLILSV